MQRVSKKQQQRTLWDRQKPDCLLWWRISPTLRCTCQCAYCSAEFLHRPQLRTVYKRRPLTPKQWISICNKLDTGLVFTGGEPFVYSGLLEVLEGVEHKVRINSNLGTLSDTDIRRLGDRGEMMILASYHHQQPGALPLEAFARKVKLLQLGGIKIKVSMIATSPEHGHKVLKPVKRLFYRKHRIKASISKDARVYDAWPGTQSRGATKRVLCQTGCLRLVGPDGFRYPCESKLVRGVGQMEDLLTDDPRPMDYDVECGEFGFCLPCDRHGPRKIETLP
jgi:hypothetical protein